MKLLFTIIVFAVFATSGGQQKAQSIDKKKLIGHWISLEDKSYHIVFTATTKTEYYGKDVEGVSTYQIDKNTLVAKDKATGEKYTYSVKTLTGENLTLIHLGRGNLLKFKRK